MNAEVKNRGWQVAIAGTSINLALGILYTWSIFKSSIKESIISGGEGSFNWDLASINDPYAICCLVFAFAMIVAGKCQDKYGPRITAFIGGILVGAGFIWISQTTDYLSWVIGFGVLAGTGIGFGYSSATPPALKWFPSAKTGLIAGLVVSGFGLASVYIAPIAKFSLGAWGLQTSMLFFGVTFLVVVCGLSFFLVNPPKGFNPESDYETTSVKNNNISVDFKSSEIIKTKMFYLLWFLYFIGSGAGLMVIGSIAGMAKQSMGEYAFLVVAIMAVGNAGGRILAGILSDKIGRKKTLTLMLSFQAILMFISIPIIGSENTQAILLVLLSTFIGFNYGTNLSIFPSFAKDLWGLKNFGTNYGILFTAWGVGGLIMGRLSQTIQASTGSYTYSFIIAGVLLIIGALLTFKIETSK
jgi:nitrate/nitrite transporter NarK